MTSPQSAPPPIPSFLITDVRTSGQSFGRQGTRQQISYNGLYYASINLRPYSGPVYDDKANRLILILRQMMLILFVVVV